MSEKLMQIKNENELVNVLIAEFGPDNDNVKFINEIRNSNDVFLNDLLDKAIKMNINYLNSIQRKNEKELSFEDKLQEINLKNDVSRENFDEIVYHYHIDKGIAEHIYKNTDKNTIDKFENCLIEKADENQKKDVIKNMPNANILNEQSMNILATANINKSAMILRTANSENANKFVEKISEISKQVDKNVDEVLSIAFGENIRFQQKLLNKNKTQFGTSLNELPKMIMKSLPENKLSLNNIPKEISKYLVEYQLKTDSLEEKKELKYNIKIVDNMWGAMWNNKSLNENERNEISNIMITAALQGKFSDAFNENIGDLKNIISKLPEKELMTFITALANCATDPNKQVISQIIKSQSKLITLKEKPLQKINAQKKQSKIGEFFTRMFKSKPQER